MFEEPADMGNAAAVEDPFEMLARRRREMGFSLEDVAQQIKFAPRQIEALEAGDCLHLPSSTFARGILRSYARLLKLDPAPMLAMLEERSSPAAPPEEAAALRASVPFTDPARRVNVAYLAISLALMVAVAALVFEWMRDDGGRTQLEFVPAAQTPPAPQTLVSSLAPTQVIEPAETPPQTEPAPAAAGGRRKIRLSFERESWVSITDRAGRTLISQLNPGGSERTVEGVPPFDVVVGNAQHVKFSYDDRSIDLMPYVKVEVARFTLD